jgi:hypothetical protein
VPWLVQFVASRSVKRYTDCHECVCGCRALCGRAATRAAIGKYAEATTDCNAAIELSEGTHWQPYHTRGLVAKLQAQMERKEVRAHYYDIISTTLHQYLSDRVHKPDLAATDV